MESFANRLTVTQAPGLRRHRAEVMRTDEFDEGAPPAACHRLNLSYRDNRRHEPVGPHARYRDRRCCFRQSSPHQEIQLC